MIYCSSIKTKKQCYNYVIHFTVKINVYQKLIDYNPGILNNSPWFSSVDSQAV